jgi:sec-independent protein translocase protein TatB
VGHNQGVFDINGGEMLVLAGVALVVLGPDKLPGYAAQAARLLRQLRTMADGAKEQMRDQLGPEFDDIDWKTLDPRQYDPRKIVRDALMTDEEAAERAAEKPVSTGGPTPVADEADQPPAPPGARSSAYDDEAT